MHLEYDLYGCALNSPHGVEVLIRRDVVLIITGQAEFITVTLMDKVPQLFWTQWLSQWREETREKQSDQMYGGQNKGEKKDITSIRSLSYHRCECGLQVIWNNQKLRKKVKAEKTSTNCGSL